MRIGQANGMHTDMPVQELGEHLVQRCRKVWWTVCLLDRQMTSLMGIPQSIRADEITCRLPDLTTSPQRRVALELQIKISHVYADIARGAFVSLQLRITTDQAWQLCMDPKHNPGKDSFLAPKPCLTPSLRWLQSSDTRFHYSRIGVCLAYQHTYTSSIFKYVSLLSPVPHCTHSVTLDGSSCHTTDTFLLPRANFSGSIGGFASSQKR